MYETSGALHTFRATAALPRMTRVGGDPILLTTNKGAPDGATGSGLREHRHD